MMPKLSEIDLLASAVREVTKHQGEESGRALAWYARNLMVQEGLAPGAVQVRLNGLRAGIEARSSSEAIDAQIRECDQPFFLAMSFVCGALAGDSEDPTGGAVLAHRHDEDPPWAMRAQPTALIGPWVFYRPR